MRYSYFILPFCLLLYGCPGEECVETLLLPYEVTFAIMPEDSVYLKGDTITFSSAIAIKDIFQDSEPPNYELSSKISVARLDSADAYPSANFHTSIILGAQYPLTHRDSTDLLDSNIANFIYSKQADSLKVKINIQLLGRGIYSFSPFAAGLKVINMRNCKQFFTMRIKYINSNNHYLLFEKYRGEGYDIATQYTFVVR